MRQSIHLFLFITFLSISAFAQGAEQTLTTAEGYQLQVTLKAFKSTVMLGEPTYINLEISSQKLCYESPDFWANFGKTDAYELKIVRDDGKIITPDSKPTGSVMHTPCQTRVPYGGFKQSRRIFLATAKVFQETGNYTVTVKQKIPTVGDFSKTAEPLTAELSTQIKVVPFNDTEFSELIEKLGTGMIQNNSDSASLFRRIDDKRTIKYYLQHLDKLSENEDKVDVKFERINVIYALGNFNDDSALEAIKTFITSPVNNIRGAVANALLASPHPKALGLLIQMRSDQFNYVRLIAVHGLGKLETEESTARLREMLKDTDELVRIKAQEILNKRVKN